MGIFPHDNYIRIISVFIIGVFLLGCSNAYAVKKIEDNQLKFILSGVNVVKEERFKNYTFRALSVREQGECDGHPNTCPKLHFYLVVSTIDEAPDTAIYELDASHNWEIELVNEIDSYSEFQKYLVIHLKRTMPAHDISKNWWRIVDYKLKINPWESIILD